MNLFLDSSALVKRYLEEPGSVSVEVGMSDAGAWIASQVTFVETLRVVASVPAAANRARRDWDEFEVVALTPGLCERAVALAQAHRLKSLDAIQLASATTAAASGLTFASFDRQLHAAARSEGFETLPAVFD